MPAYVWQSMGRSNIFSFITHEEKMKELLEKRIAELKAELEQLMCEANRQIGMKQGAIAELERILKDQEKE